MKGHDNMDMNISTLKIGVCTIIGTVGSVVANLFGGWSDDMITLVICMGIDFIMGLAIAGIFHKSSKTETGALDSKVGWKGLCKKGVTLLFVLIAYRLDILFNTEYIRTATIIGFIANEVISIVENAGLMGLPLPSVIVKAIDVLKNKADKDGETE